VVNVVGSTITVKSTTAITATEGQSSPTQTLVTFTDSVTNPGGLSAVVDWGDGSSTTYTGNGGGIVQNADGSFSVLGSHTYSEEAASLSVMVAITDATGGSASATTTASVSDPDVIVTGGFTLAANPGVLLSGATVATFVDPGGAEPVTDASGTHYTADIAWGDGQTSTGTVVYDPVAKNFKVTGDHIYATAGSYPIGVTVHHESAPDAITTSSAKIGAPVVIGQGPRDANTLLIYGTAGDDKIQVIAADNGAVKVVINGVSQGTYAKGGFASLAIYGLEGNDSIQVDNDLKYVDFLFGGPGNDVLKGDGGPSMLDGGSGNDTLTAGEGPSILIGGDGADKLFGGDSSPLLISGSVDFSNQGTPAASPQLTNLLSAWSATSQSYLDRAAAVDAILAGHVQDDGQKDTLTSGNGMTLYYAGTGDTILDKKKGELVHKI
jgi:Ca2+-binding RTX toxin-like protein